MLCYYAECCILFTFYAECHYAECHYAQCRYAECRYAECRYDECLSAVKKGNVLLSYSLLQNWCKKFIHLLVAPSMLQDNPKMCCSIGRFGKLQDSYLNAIQQNKTFPNDTKQNNTQHI